MSQMAELITPALNPDIVRNYFPTVGQEWVFMDNAGGSQIAQPVLDRLQSYLLSSNVQLGASYALSQLATERVHYANQVAATLINARDVSEVVMGPSTSMLLRILAATRGRMLQPEAEIIVTNCDHEANITPWLELQSYGIEVKTWAVNPHTLTLDLTDLEALLTPKTRLVALTHTSNVLGTINPIRQIADLVHAHGAQICVDGVGYAPHRLVDVQALDVDFYVFSFYKVFGPHHAVLYGKHEALLPLPSFNHAFIGADQVPYKLQPGAANYELSYSTVGITDYLQGIARAHFGSQTGVEDRQQLVQAFDLITQYEALLCDRILSFLNHKPNVRIVGLPTADPTQRVPTIAFVIDGVDSSTIPPHLDAQQIGIRYGHFYAKRLIHDLGLAEQNGVVRISLVHYNTLEECDRTLEQLDRLI